MSKTLSYINLDLNMKTEIFYNRKNSENLNNKKNEINFRNVNNRFNKKTGTKTMLLKDNVETYYSKKLMKQKENFHFLENFFEPIGLRQNIKNLLKLDLVADNKLKTYTIDKKSKIIFNSFKNSELNDGYLTYRNSNFIDTFNNIQNTTRNINNNNTSLYKAQKKLKYDEIIKINNDFNFQPKINDPKVTYPLMHPKILRKIEKLKYKEKKMQENENLKLIENEYKIAKFNLINGSSDFRKSFNYDKYKLKKLTLKFPKKIEGLDYYSNKSKMKEPYIAQTTKTSSSLNNLRIKKNEKKKLLNLILNDGKLLKKIQTNIQYLQSD